MWRFGQAVKAVEHNTDNGKHRSKNHFSAPHVKNLQLNFWFITKLSLYYIVVKKSKKGNVLCVLYIKINNGLLVIEINLYI